MHCALRTQLTVMPELSETSPVAFCWCKCTAALTTATCQSMRHIASLDDTLGSQHHKRSPVLDTRQVHTSSKAHSFYLPMALHDIVSMREGCSWSATRITFCCDAARRAGLWLRAALLLAWMLCPAAAAAAAAALTLAWPGDSFPVARLPATGSHLGGCSRLVIVSGICVTTGQCLCAKHGASTRPSTAALSACVHMYAVQEGAC